jgi:hypothetical protein
MKEYIKKFLETNQINPLMAEAFLTYYGDEIAKAKFPMDFFGREIANMIDWNYVVNRIALKENLIIYKIYNKNGQLIKQYLQE